jgi:hypothetical protein
VWEESSTSSASKFPGIEKQGEPREQRNCAIVFDCLLVAVAFLFTGRGPAPKVAASTLKAGGGTSPHVIQNYGNLPLRFEANQGQTDSQVKFLSRGIGYTLFLTSTESVLVLSKSTPPEAKRQLSWRQSDIFGPAVKPDSSAPTIVRMTLPGANPHAGIEGQGELPGASNYLIGNDPAKWRTNVSSYAKVRYRLCHLAGGELEQIQFLLGHVSVQTTEQRLRGAVNDHIGIEPPA